jgi:hypothetical protein
MTILSGRNPSYNLVNINGDEEIEILWNIQQAICSQPITSIKKFTSSKFISICIDRGDRAGGLRVPLIPRMIHIRLKFTCILFCEMYCYLLIYQF